MSNPYLPLRATFILLAAGTLAATLRGEEPTPNRATAVAELKKYDSWSGAEVQASATKRLAFGCHSNLPDSAFAMLAAFPELEELKFLSDKVTDACLGHLKQLPELRVLQICSATITDEGLDSLQDLPKLAELTLMRTQLTDEGLRKLQALRGLKSLTLIRLNVTPELIEQLKHFEHLDKLHISQTDFTEEQKRELTTALPNLTIK
jgi:hypothetical protein